MANPVHIRELLKYCDAGSIKYSNSGTRSYKVLNCEGMPRTIYRPKKTINCNSESPCAFIGLFGKNYFYYPISVANLTGAALNGARYSCISELMFSYDEIASLLRVKLRVHTETLECVNARRPPLPVVVVNAPPLPPPPPAAVAAILQRRAYIPRHREPITCTLNYTPAVMKLQERIFASVIMQQTASVVYVAKELLRERVVKQVQTTCKP